MIEDGQVSRIGDAINHARILEMSWTTRRRTRVSRVQHQYLGAGIVSRAKLQILTRLDSDMAWVPYRIAQRLTTDADPAKIQAQSEMQHLLVMQCHSYTNATFSIAAARAGYDDGEFGLIGCSCKPHYYGDLSAGIVHPEGQIIARSSSMDDELVMAEIDLDDAQIGKSKVFNFGLHRQVHQYKIITEQSGAIPPPRLT